MQGSRDFTVKRKPRIILDKSFSIINNLELGDIGQIEIEGYIEGEELKAPDDNISKFIRIEKVKLIDKKEKRMMS